MRKNKAVVSNIIFGAIFAALAAVFVIAKSELVDTAVLAAITIEFAVFYCVTNNRIKSIKNSQKQFNIFINSINLPAYIVDIKEYTIIMENAFAISTFGNCIGKKCYEAIWGFDNICADCKNDCKKDEEINYKINNLSKRYYKVTEKYMDWTDGRRVKVVVLSDETVIKEMEENREYRLSLLKRLNLFTCFINAKGEIVFVNELGREWFGLEEGSVSIDFNAIFSEEQAERIISEILPRTRRDGTAEEEFELIKRDNQEINVKMQVFKVSGKESGFIGYAMAITDISDNKLAKSYSNELARKINSMIENYPGIMWMTDKNDNFAFAGGEGFKIFGMNPKDIIGQNIHKSGLCKSPENLELVDKNGFAQWQISEGGLHLKCSAKRVTDEKGNILGKVGISTDITDFVNMQKELERAINEANKANNSKSDFLSKMSHEIRTPLNAIIGMTKIARASKDTEKAEYCMEKVDEASRQLLGIVNDILDISKMESNKFELSFQKFNLERMLLDVCHAVNVKVEEKKQQFTVDIASDIPMTIIADEVRLNQVLTNIILNAVKFTGEGGRIKLSCKNVSKSDDKVIIQFEVSDNGIGISKEQQKELFKSFNQVSEGAARKFGGTGLGLSICKSIVEMMDGKIWITSEENKGAAFTFTIDVKYVKLEEHREISRDIDTGKLNILVVDDSEDVIEFFIDLMGTLGIKSKGASGGREAIAMLQESIDKGAPFNMVFLDLNMPEQGGVETAKEINRIFGDSVIVVMISIAEKSEIEEAVKIAKIDRFIEKPLFPSVVVNTINELMSGKIKREKGVFSEFGYNFSGKRILFAEDVEINREILVSLLEDTKTEVDCVENGQLAVDIFKENPDKYDLILMDVHMPVLDGYDATKQIRRLQNEKAAKVPIIAMTANAFKDDIDKCLECGMNDHLAKPIDSDVLLRKLDKYLYMKEETSEKPLSPPPEFIDFTKFLPYVDVETGLNRLRNNEKLYMTLLKSYKGQQMCKELLDSIQAGDTKKAVATAHAIKGIAANLSLSDIFENVVIIERQLKNDVPVTGVLLKNFENTVNTTTEYIKELIDSRGDKK